MVTQEDIEYCKNFVANGMARYYSIYPCPASVLQHLFFSIGGGYKDSEISEILDVELLTSEELEEIIEQQTIENFNLEKDMFIFKKSFLEKKGKEHDAIFDDNEVLIEVRQEVEANVKLPCLSMESFDIEFNANKVLEFYAKTYDQALKINSKLLEKEAVYVTSVSANSKYELYHRAIESNDVKAIRLALFATEVYSLFANKLCSKYGIDNPNAEKNEIIVNKLSNIVNTLTS